MGIMTLCCWNKPLGWSQGWPHSPVVSGWVAKPGVLSSSFIVVLQLRFNPPLSMPTWVGVPLIFATSGVGKGRSSTCFRLASG